MAQYYRASELEPTKDDLHSILMNSSPADWLFDDENNSFTYRNNLLVFLAPNDRESYTLRYGHMDVFDVPNNFMNERIFAAPEWSVKDRIQSPSPSI